MVDRWSVVYMLPTGGAPAENGFWLIVRLKNL